MVRAKFRVMERKESGAWGGGGKTSESVKLVACTDDKNKEWAKYTPSGSIEMTIDNPAALDQFKVGDEFYVDFSPTEGT